MLHTLLRSFAADGMKMMVMQWEARMMMKSRLLKQQTMGKAGENWPELYWIRLKVYLGFGWKCIEDPAGIVLKVRLEAYQVRLEAYLYCFIVLCFLGVYEPMCVNA